MALHALRLRLLDHADDDLGQILHGECAVRLAIDRRGDRRVSCEHEARIRHILGAQDPIGIRVTGEQDLEVGCFNFGSNLPRHLKQSDQIAA